MSTSPYFSHAAAGGAGTMLPPITTSDVMRVPIKGTDLVIEIDAVRNEAGIVSAIALFQLVRSICGLTKQQTKDTIDSLLAAKSHLEQVYAPLMTPQ